MEKANAIKHTLKWTAEGSSVPDFICGSALEVMRTWPDECIDFCMTSPPYWGHREYSGGGIGLEATCSEYIANLCQIFSQVYRVLKPSGSFWLNVGDTYDKKALVGVPWRLAFALTDSQGWILRNSVVWNKVKGGPDTAKDRLRNVHENVFILSSSSMVITTMRMQFAIPPRRARW